ARWHPRGTGVLPCRSVRAVAAAITVFRQLDRIPVPLVVQGEHGSVLKRRRTPRGWIPGAHHLLLPAVPGAIVGAAAAGGDPSFRLRFALRALIGCFGADVRACSSSARNVRLTGE